MSLFVYESYRFPGDGGRYEEGASDAGQAEGVGGPADGAIRAFTADADLHKMDDFCFFFLKKPAKTTLMFATLSPVFWWPA